MRDTGYGRFPAATFKSQSVSLAMAQSSGSYMQNVFILVFYSNYEHFVCCFRDTIIQPDSRQ